MFNNALRVDFPSVSSASRDSSAWNPRASQSGGHCGPGGRGYRLRLLDHRSVRATTAIDRQGFIHSHRSQYIAHL